MEAKIGGTMEDNLLTSRKVCHGIGEIDLVIFQIIFGVVFNVSLADDISHTFGIEPCWDLW